MPAKYALKIALKSDWKVIFVYCLEWFPGCKYELVVHQISY